MSAAVGESIVAGASAGPVRGGWPLHACTTSAAERHHQTQLLLRRVWQVLHRCLPPVDGYAFAPMGHGRDRVFWWLVTATGALGGFMVVWQLTHP